MNVSRTHPLIASFATAALILPPPAAHAEGPRPVGVCEPSSGWAPTAHRIDPDDSYHAYVGNGYLGARVPPAGAGYAATGEKTGWPLYTPRYDGAFVTGLYGRGPANTEGREAIAALPTWTGLDVTAGDETYGPGSRVSNYRQTLFLRCGFVRTAVTWTAADGRRTDLVYDVLTDRTAAHTAAVRLRLTPHWDGEATVTDRIDGRGARRIAQTGGGAAGERTMDVAFRTDGTDVDGAVASTLRAPGEFRRAGGARELSAAQSATFAVRSGRTYDVSKYVGVDTALTSRSPRAAAQRTSQLAARRGWPALFAAHTAAWRRLWSSSIEVPGRPDIQLWVRSAQYGLLSGTRRGARDSIAPTGLTSDNYAGMVFWDAETWMFPALLATRPELARTVLEYRYRTRAVAAQNAARTSVKGLFYPWTSASRGALYSECQSWDPPHCLTQNHLQGDIALAAWQYYLATGDRTWLRARGWPLLRGLAEYWASRVTANSDGSYSIKNVAGPDEYSNGVDDAVYTNAVAATALRNATRASALVGATAPPAWARIADGMRIPYDAGRKVFLQYDGYAGSQIKQADTVLLMYPLEWPMPDGAAAATLDYYTERTDPDGPAMTDSVHAIDAAAIGEPGCAAYTFLQRAYRPFARGPFALFSEARGDKAGAGDPLAGSPAQDFLTGKGGFLQVFTHGLTGLRLRENTVRLDPTLPPQLEDGVRLSGLRWQGRTYDIAIGPEETTVRLVSGEPFTVESPQGRVTVSEGFPARLKTRRPDLEPTANTARCRPATATSEEPGLYAAAAVDGNAATYWRPEDPDASLTVELARTAPLSEVRVTGTRAYTTRTSMDGAHWRAPEPGVAARYVRVTLTGTKPGEVRELSVR
ncbi:glycoside hydrolase family 65 protein [Streptomyces sp. PSKA54]|uniref:Glycoside hydrolase family 65 protein n=1 Tax=Streptomyces himalayensis subsp. aureolus TaxID=2758039 RepID=A0A7W2D7S5_9ACTN|nr:glycosyl hydrolase family 65 protein [Streptomyces himalayensis]MBA4866360.1 glycoside hydrolase family 65 protein [Streptomyces himalayensis subsp. aureolus]